MEMQKNGVPYLYGNGVPYLYGNESHTCMEMSPILVWKWICMSLENQVVTKPPNKK